MGPTAAAAGESADHGHERMRPVLHCIDRIASRLYRAPVSGDPPPLTVLDAFGVNGPARLLDGGQGTSWAVEDLAFKPDEGPLHEWLASALADVTPDGFRIAQPVCTRDGAWVSRGWSAARWVEGSKPDYSAISTWQEILAAGRAFHRAVAHLGRPDFLDSRQDWWARADKAVWGERDIRFRPEFAAVARRLQGALEPLGRPQIVHGDLTNNVLFVSGLAPAVIDISTTWRDPQWAELPHAGRRR